MAYFSAAAVMERTRGRLYQHVVSDRKTGRGVGRDPKIASFNRDFHNHVTILLHHYNIMQTKPKIRGNKGYQERRASSGSPA